MWNDIHINYPHISDITSVEHEKRVFTAYDSMRGKKIVLKSMNKRVVINTIQNHWLCAHWNIAVPNLYMMGTFLQDTDEAFIAYEYIPGIDLFTYVTEEGPIDTDTSISIIKSIYTIIEMLIKLQHVHLDIKLENFVYNKETKDVYLIDLELMRRVVNDELKQVSNNIGTLLYQSPEAKKKQYHKNTDLWGLGLIGFILLLSYNPLQIGIKEDEIQKYALSELSGKYNNNIVDLIYNLLDPDPKLRKWTGKI